MGDKYTQTDRFVEARDDEGDRVVYDGDFLQMRVRTFPDSPGEYEYVHESRCDGDLVAVLPFEVEDGRASRFLLRVERCHGWGDYQAPCAFTGGVESDRPVEDAVRELREESGYRVDESEMVDLGACRGTKATDSTYHLYAVDVTDLERGEPEPDGRDEARGDITWTRDVTESEDPHLHTMWARLVHMFADRQG